MTRSPPFHSQIAAAAPCWRLWSLAALGLALGVAFAAAFAHPAQALDAAPDPGIDLRLDQVRDVTELSIEDNPAYYGLLEKARTTPTETLAAAGGQFVRERQRLSKRSTFLDMLLDPQAWRGQPVRLQGHVLQTLTYDAAENPYGIATLYEAALYTDDAQSHPVTVVFLEKPDELPIGGQLVDGVEVSGYFLKLYLYPSSDRKTRKAPLILARTVTVNPPPAPGPLLPALWPLLVGGLALILSGLFAGLAGYRRSKSFSKRTIRTESGPPDFTALP